MFAKISHLFFTPESTDSKISTFNNERDSKRNKDEKNEKIEKKDDRINILDLNELKLLRPIGIVEAILDSCTICGIDFSSLDEEMIIALIKHQIYCEARSRSRVQSTKRVHFIQDYLAWKKFYLYDISTKIKIELIKYQRVQEQNCITAIEHKIQGSMPHYAFPMTVVNLSQLEIDNLLKPFDWYEQKQTQQDETEKNILEETKEFVSEKDVIHFGSLNAKQKAIVQKQIKDINNYMKDDKELDRLDSLMLSSSGNSQPLQPLQPVDDSFKVNIH